MIDSSNKTSDVGLCLNPAPAIWWSAASSKAIPDPSPPIVNEGRTTTGYPSIFTPSKISSIVWQITERADSPPIFSTIVLKISRFSPRSIASTSAPMSFTPYRSSVPAA